MVTAVVPLTVGVAVLPVAGLTMDLKVYEVMGAPLATAAVQLRVILDLSSAVLVVRPVGTAGLLAE